MKYVTFLNGPQESTMKTKGATASNGKSGKGKNKGKSGKGKRGRKRRSLANDMKALWESETPMMRAAKFFGSVFVGLHVVGQRATLATPLALAALALVLALAALAVA
jgi:hypothetical protein